MLFDKKIIGLDIGSVSISAAVLDAEKKVLSTAYEFHHGKVPQVLETILNTLSSPGEGMIAATSSTPHWVRVEPRYDNLVSMIASAKHFHGSFKSILFVGAEKFGLIEFDDDGNYTNCQTNTSCAAGTGSFLDQQAGRLNLSGIEELSRIADQNTGEIPKIASRCAVFAKTDLIHAQNIGHCFDEISEGLCRGLAKNIVDTLFGGRKRSSQVVFCGGVSKNRAVIKHIRELAGVDILQNEVSHLYGAIGAALSLIEDMHDEADDELHRPIQYKAQRLSVRELVTKPPQQKKSFYFKPLELRLSDYPEFKSIDTYKHTAVFDSSLSPVEVDIYKTLENGKVYDVYFGVDIGSTSTKAVLMDTRKNVLAGFYTRTSGRPVSAIQSICEAIDAVREKKSLHLNVIACGTTGSGRKFVGKVIGANMAVDEITAHARAAYEINPDVDTIIEIGGQDSKFTTLRNGMVTSAVMNNVCAAGTGSFIEEQALKFGCAISDYAERTLNKKAPMSSDRCTVFMERDMNHYLNEGYAIDEVLASALHSVRENYLLKVATEKNIGDVVFFQGATAKNKALVAAFEQRLNKPIIVSPFCHLTGAYGAALILHDEAVSDTSFRGFGLYKKSIPIRSEICELCTNHCKLTIADIGEEREAYGFLCGRDYDTQKHVSNNTSGFDLINARKRAFRMEPKTSGMAGPTIGIPAAMYMVEDIPLWKAFFDDLSINTVTSETYTDAVREGKNISQAEFCAPVSAMHGHVRYLLEQCDYVFLPFYLETKKREKGVMRQFCYYSQYAPAVVGSLDSHGDRILSPVVKYLYSHFHTKKQLYQVLKPIFGDRIHFRDISSAYDKAIAFKKRGVDTIKEMFHDQFRTSDDISIVFLGRPYTILCPSENKGIPNIFASMGIKTFFQDMLTVEKKDVEPIAPLLNELHWHYASTIMAAAEVISNTEGLYPVFVTTFKCTPDSFTLDYFKHLMHVKEKPYLVLELDEHGSSVGYETRIEAAIRAFRNHAQVKNDQKAISYTTINPIIEKHYRDKTIVIPNWDSMVCSLLAFNLQREGLDAIIMEETDASIQKGVRFNSGQCIPLNAITQAFVDTVKSKNLDPEATILWMFKAGVCSVKLFPHHMKHLLRAYGNGMEKAGICTGDISFSEISFRTALNTYFAFMFGGLLRKMACRIRPYEVHSGETDAAVEKSMAIFKDAFLGNRSKEVAVREAVSLFKTIHTDRKTRPKVAIFGDLYVRDNDVMNQGLIRFIEANGGEVMTTPYHQYCKMIAAAYFKKWFIEKNYMGLISYKALLTTVLRMEKIYYKYFEEILQEPDLEFRGLPDWVLAAHKLAVENTGESMENILKTYYIKEHYPDVSLFVQTSPAFCCPSLVTESMRDVIERQTGIPVVSVTYDGTGGTKNETIIPYLKYPRNVFEHSEKVEKNYGI